MPRNGLTCILLGTLHIWVKITMMDNMQKCVTFSNFGPQIYQLLEKARLKPKIMVCIILSKGVIICEYNAAWPAGAPLGGPRSRQIKNFDILGEFRSPQGGTWGVSGCFLLYTLTFLLKSFLDITSLFV